MSRFGSSVGGLIAAGAAALAISAASPVSATTYVKLISDEMNYTFQAHIQGEGNAYANGVTFHVQTSTSPGGSFTTAPDLFGFCVDIFHNITAGPLGNPYSLHDDIYVSTQPPGDVPPPGYNPLPTDFGGNTILPTQLSALTNLIDTGYILHQNQNGGHDFDTEMRLAAIQAAIWAIAVPTKAVTVNSTNLTTSGGYLSYASQYAAYQAYFAEYVSGNYTSLADANDSFYVISDYDQGAGDPNNGGRINQAFAIGWPVDAGVPEPATWGLMIMGFGAIGAVLRRRRQATAFA